MYEFGQKKKKNRRRVKLAENMLDFIKFMVKNIIIKKKKQIRKN